MKSIGIVGAGTMGSGIAHVASLSQYSVLLMDINEHLVEKGINSINRNIFVFLSIACFTTAVTNKP